MRVRCIRNKAMDLPESVRERFGLNPQTTWAGLRVGEERLVSAVQVYSDGNMEYFVVSDDDFSWWHLADLFEVVDTAVYGPWSCSRVAPDSMYWMPGVVFICGYPEIVEDRSHHCAVPHVDFLASVVGLGEKKAWPIHEQAQRLHLARVREMRRAETEVRVVQLARNSLARQGSLSSGGRLFFSAPYIVSRGDAMSADDYDSVVCVDIDDALSASPTRVVTSVYISGLAESDAETIAARLIGALERSRK